MALQLLIGSTMESSRLGAGSGESRPRWRLGAAAAVLGVAGLATAVSRPGLASDHDDAPSLAAEKGADIADVFAFMRPGSTSHMVLAMTVNPGASGTTSFDSTIDYAFRVLGYGNGALDPTVDTTIVCRFEALTASGQLVLCTGNGFSTFATVGTLPNVDAGDASAPMRVFVGLRADPAFGDIGALKSTLANKQLSFVDAGTNAFAGKNVLAIVLEVDVDKVLLAGIATDGGDGGVRPQLAISATTERP